MASPLRTENASGTSFSFRDSGGACDLFKTRIAASLLVRQGLFECDVVFGHALLPISILSKYLKATQYLRIIEPIPISRYAASGVTLRKSRQCGVFLCICGAGVKRGSVNRRRRMCLLAFQTCRGKNHGNKCGLLRTFLPGATNALMPTKNGFQLQDRDIELLHFVHELRIATIDHLAALSGRSVRALWVGSSTQTTAVSRLRGSFHAEARLCDRT